MMYAMKYGGNFIFPQDGCPQTIYLKILNFKPLTISDSYIIYCILILEYFNTF